MPTTTNQPEGNNMKKATGAVLASRTSSVATVSPKKKPRHLKRVLLFAAIIILAIGSGVGATLLYQYKQRNNSVITQHQTTINDGNAATTTEETTIDNVVSKVSSSIVSILTTSDVSSYIYGTTTADTAGSGIIVSGDGVILTNKHVIDGAKTLSVILSDGTTYTSVKVIATDPVNDIAYLKISDVKDLPAAELGDSSTVRVGQSVIAIGNSLGQYQNTVTSGIISGKGRPVSAQSGTTVESLNDLLQTDAAINPGNSGGPLLNTGGQVIGINTAIIENAQGIGFSIPINAVKGMLKQILNGSDSPQHSYLGVRYVQLNAAIAKKFNLSVSTGAYVYNSSNSSTSAVVSGSPADKSGIKTGDVITSINGVKVGEGGGVSSLVSEYAPGDTIEVTIVRGSETKTLKVTLAAYPSSSSAN